MLTPLLLDLDGVLVDSTAVHAEAWRALFAAFGIAFDRQRYDDEANGRSRGDVIRAVLGSRPDHDVLMARKAQLVEQHLHAHGCAPMAGARAFLEEAGRRGHPMAVATSSRMPGPFLRAAGLHDLLPIVVDRSQVARGKPAPDIFLEAARRLDVDPTTAAVVEDSPAGLQAARAAGCLTIGLTSTHTADELDADHVVDHLMQVLAVLAD